MTEQPSLYALNIDYASPITRAAWDILNQAESGYDIVTTSREQADCAGYLEPEEPGEYLWWMLDEAQRLEDVGNENMQEDDEGERVHSEGVWFAADQYEMSTILRRYAINLMELSIPSVPPTRREENPDAR